MNRKCTVNPVTLNSFNFKHNFTYRLLYYVILYYDFDSKRLYLDKDDVSQKYNINRVSLRNAINELIENDIIVKYNGFKNVYKVNNKLFV
jgi:hypothetical protein